MLEKIEIEYTYEYLQIKYWRYIVLMKYYALCQFCHLNFINNFDKAIHTIFFFENEPHRRALSKCCNIKFNFIGFEAVKTLNAWATFWWIINMYRKENTRRNQSRRYQKALYFVDNLRVNVLRNVYSLDLNYDMELKIQGRVHSGKLRITVPCKHKWSWSGKTSSKCSSTKFVSF